MLKTTHAKDSGLISVNAQAKYALQGHALFSVALKTSTVDKRDAKSLSKELRELISELNDVFPEILPKGLPPKRAQDFNIKLKPLS